MTNTPVGRIVDEYALSPMQQGMLFHGLRDPAAGVDLEQVSCTIDGVEIAVFLRAWEHATREHALLRTAFRWKDVDFPTQQVFADAPLAVRVEDLRELSLDAQRKLFQQYIRDDRRAGFDLGALPLFRLAFFRTAEHRFEFVWTFPHLLLDGRSFVLVLRDVIEALRAFENSTTPAPVLRRPYREFIEWLGHQDPAPAREFWTRTLAGFTAPVVPDVGPVEIDRSAEEYAEAATRLSRPDTAAVKAFAKRHDLTVNTLVQGAWALLLSRYTGSSDVVFGATRACRRTPLDGDPAVGDMVGLFINSLPVRVRIDPELPVVAWLRGIREDQIAVRMAEHTPLTDVQAQSAIPAGLPLFETLLVFEHEQQSTSFSALDPRFTNFRLREKTTLPVTLHGYGEDELLLRFEYDRTRFDDAAIERMLGHLTTLLRALVPNDDARLGDVSMLPHSERQLLLAEWNATDDPSIRHDTTVTQLLSDRVTQCPDNIALVFGADALTYRELDARTGALARFLAARGVTAGSMVGVCLARSPEMVVSLIAVMRAGAAYVPLDPEYPADRLAFMIADAECAVILSQHDVAETKLTAARPAAGTTIICVDREWNEIVAAAAALPPPTPPKPDDLAYVIYTSGSTGRPKGAMNRHRGVVNMLLWMQREHALTSADAVLQKIPISFDVSVAEMFLPLMAGARLVVAQPGVQRDPMSLARAMNEQRATVLFFVPSGLRAFLDVDSERLPPAIRSVIAIGEALSVDLQEACFAQWPDVQLYNWYGPAECAVGATYWICRRADPRRIVPIGRPMANVRCYIVDPEMRPLPVGILGELCLSGVQVGAGYHRRPELTAERFVADPFAGTPDAKMYRTGDRVRWLQDGTIDFQGRLDFQIKLRGFRIEIGEIEAVLGAHESVRECAVLLRTDPGIDPRLVAYYVPIAGATPAPAELRAHLEASVPDYMVPWLYVPVESFPISPSGKLDRAALPAPERIMVSGERVAPRDDVEARVLRVWEHVLGKTDFGVTDRFNEVGGNSLAAVRVFGRIAKEFERELELSTILKHDSVAKLADLLREATPSDAWSCIVPIATAAAGVPIFCVHPSTGNVVIYQHFAKEVSPHHPVYGIQAYGNWGTQDPHESIEEMVGHYIDAIVRVQPSGPYILFGHSLGGRIALELAHAMRARGHDVLLLAMYDTGGAGYPRYTLRGRTRLFVQQYGIPWDRITGIFAPDPEKGRTRWTIYWNLRETVSSWYDTSRRGFLSWKYRNRNPPHGFPMPAKLTRVALASRRVLARHTARFWPGKLTYFRAQRQPRGIVPDPRNGWGELCAEMEIHHLPSGHNDAMAYPVVSQMAREFLECIERAQRARAGNAP